MWTLYVEHFILLGARFYWFPLYGVQFCSGSLLSYMELVLSFCNLLLKAFLGPANNHLLSRADLVPPLNWCLLENSTPFLLVYEFFLLWLQGTETISSPIRLWGPAAYCCPVVLYSPLNPSCDTFTDQFSAQISADVKSSFCAALPSGALPCSFQPLCSVWFPSRCTQSSGSALGSKLEKSPGSPHSFPFCQDHSPALPVVPCLEVFVACCLVV